MNNDMFLKLQQAMIGATGGKSVAKLTTVSSFVILLANLFIIIAFGLSVVSLALSLVQFATSSGDPKQAQKAQNGIMWSVLGMIIALLAFALKAIFIKFAGIADVQ
jgi:hypothetical protein